MSDSHTAPSDRQNFVVTDYASFFRSLTGVDPYPYQERLAVHGLPDVLPVPTGLGKTAAIFCAWLYWLLHLKQGSRRLVLVLPLRSLCTDVERSVHQMLSRGGLSEIVDVHVIMGGGSFDSVAHQEWRMHPERPSVVICTVDAAISSMLNRSYFATRSASVLDMALLTNDAHIVLDEGHLNSQAVATLVQLRAFQQKDQTMGKSSLTVMSATLDERALDTIDRPAQNLSRIEIDDQDRAFESLRRRLEAERRLSRLDVTKPKQLGEAAAAAFDGNNLVLVVCNSVQNARAAADAARKLVDRGRILLVHSRFRAADRDRQQKQLDELRRTGGVIVSTQCLEAGVDLDAQVLITEASPLASFTQRVGRCNRRGLLSGAQAQVLWFSPLDKNHPYVPAEIDALMALLAQHEGELLTAALLDAWRQEVPEPDLQRRVLRRRDYRQLFDTATDLAGDDVDIRPFISSDEDTDIAMAWLPDGELTQSSLAEREHRPPPMECLCPVSLSQARKLLDRAGVEAAAFRGERDSWERIQGKNLRPRDVVLVASSSGGYTEEGGFDPTSKVPVLSWESVACEPDADGTISEPGAISESGQWVQLATHLQDAKEEATNLLNALPHVSPEVVAVIEVACLCHDFGKAFKPWQEILTNTGHVPEGGPWAKSPTNGRKCRTSGMRIGFRHEVMSALMLLTDRGSELLNQLGVSEEMSPLVRYLVAAHHGKLRVSVSDPRRDGYRGDALFGICESDFTPQCDLLGVSIPSVPVPLAHLTDLGSSGWSEQIQDLIDEWGVFRLAYLEMLVRIADWRASSRDYGREDLWLNMR